MSSTIQLLQQTEVPEGRKGRHRIERFEVSQEAANFQNMRAMIGSSSRYIRPGRYTRLMRVRDAPFDGDQLPGEGTCVMSDTPCELMDHLEAIHRAQGHCLVHGLGLGIIVEAMLRKDGVERVTVVEISPDVIGLVGPYLYERWGGRVEIVEADCMTWKPPRGARYGAVWHDIWDNICADNLPDMKHLHRRYGRRCEWQGSWARERIRQ